MTKPYCKFPTGKGIIPQLRDPKTFTEKEDNSLDSFLTDLNWHLKTTHEHDQAVIKHIFPETPSPDAIIAHALEQGKITMPNFLEFLKRRKK